MSHLRDRLAALVDGELDHDRRDRVLAHLAACRECRREAEELRALKVRLARLPTPPVPAELTERLMVLGIATAARPPGPPCGAAAGVAPRPGTPRPRAGVRPRAQRRGAVRPGFGRPRAARFALAGGALVAAALSTAFAAGGSVSPPGPAIAPPVESYAVEHAATAPEVPFGDPAGAVAVTVSAPGGLRP